MKVSVLIPGYNVEKTIGALVAAIKSKGLDVVVVDDGSLDQTAKVSRASGAFVLSHPTNRGKGMSIKDGFDYLSKLDYDAVITMDGDGQHHPDDIGLFLAKAEHSTAALLIGNRMHDPKGMPLIRRITNRFMSYLLSRITKVKMPDTQCGFRLVKKSLLKELAITSRKFEVESEVIVRAAQLRFAIDEVPIRSIYKDERSKIRPFRDMLRFIRFLFRHER